MKLAVLFFLLGSGLLFIKIKKWMIIEGWLVAIFYAMFVILMYWSIHKKNKERNTPRPVYITKPGE